MGSNDPFSQPIHPQFETDRDFDTLMREHLQGSQRDFPIHEELQAGGGNGNEISGFNYKSMFQEGWQENFDQDHIWRISQQDTYPSTSTQPFLPTPLPTFAPSGSLETQDTPVPILVFTSLEIDWQAALGYKGTKLSRR